jgi:hypothetical protein
MDTTQVMVTENCDFACQFEWIEVSSNFFSVAVYTPALLVSLAGYAIYRAVKRAKRISYEKK